MASYKTINVAMVVSCCNKEHTFPVNLPVPADLEAWKQAYGGEAGLIALLNNTQSDRVQFQNKFARPKIERAIAGGMSIPDAQKLADQLALEWADQRGKRQLAGPRTVKPDPRVQAFEDLRAYTQLFAEGNITLEEYRRGTDEIFAKFPDILGK